MIARHVEPIVTQVVFWFSFCLLVCLCFVIHAEVPYFRRFIPAEIDRIADGFLKVIENIDELRGFADASDARADGQWYGKVNKTD